MSKRKLFMEVDQCACGNVIVLDYEILPGCSRTQCAACRPVHKCKKTRRRRTESCDDDEDDFDYGIPSEDEMELFEYLLRSTN